MKKGFEDFFFKNPEKEIKTKDFFFLETNQRGLFLGEMRGALMEEGGSFWGQVSRLLWVAKLRYHTRHYIWKGGGRNGYLFFIKYVKKARFFFKE